MEARSSIDELSTRLALAESQLQESSSLQTELRDAEGRHSEEVSALRREAADLRSSLSAVSQERDTMQEQVSTSASRPAHFAAILAYQSLACAMLQ